MSRSYLFGPVTPEFADQNLHTLRREGVCRTFGNSQGVDVMVRPEDSWDSVAAQLPAGWQPDFLALWLPYTTVPPALWSVPVPIVGLAADWNLLWHGYRTQLRRCDLILTDAAGVEAFQRQGLSQARSANLFGLERGFLDYPWPDGHRDIDVLFVGNLNPSVQGERLSWLGRLAELGTRWNVVLQSGVFGDDYRELLARARIVFNRGIRGECNKRTFEAVAAGALLFQEAGNREVASVFRESQEYIAYTEEDLEERLGHYLEHEDERRQIAQAARDRAGNYGFADLWQQAVTEIIEAEWDALRARSKHRPVLGEVEGLLVRSWQQLGSSWGSDSALAVDIGTALAAQPQSAALHNALGLLASRPQPGPITTDGARQALPYFQRALSHEPAHVVAALNRVECLTALDDRQAAIDQARETLGILDRVPQLPPAVLDAPHFPGGFDPFGVAWERAAWTHAGRPRAEEDAKGAVLRWRLHFLLAELTGDLRHYYEAALSRPDLPVTRAMLGCALARAGRPADAVPHLRQVVAANPFDRSAARALFQALGECGQLHEQRRFARQRRLLAAAAPAVVPQEEWFATAPPPGDELASIIVLCCNELDFTRQCLESVLRHTRRPYELVLVDNGSTDGTPAYLAEIQGRAGPSRVEVIRNDSNRGFAGGCNQALARARGDYVVFLNNDTIVPPGWLDGLVAWALSDWPTVGLVGPVANYSRPPQQIAVDYVDQVGIDAFAARRRRDFAGKALAVERLTGFCLLTRREVLAKIGGFDEDYGVGFFEDDDLSVRARQAGYKLLVALEVFVHHYGSRTFAGLGVDCQKQLHDNFERFRNKWGGEHARGYRVPEPSPGSAPAAVSPAAALTAPEDAVADAVARALAVAPTAIVTAGPRARPRVSLCLIVKNEEDNLEDCLRSAGDLVDEIVVVDTGSTDRTKDIAARCGAQVFDFPWVDSFAAARNQSLQYATGDWVLWMDADDRLDDDNRQKLRALLANLPSDNAAFVMKCLCLPDPVQKTATVVDHVRLFRNHPEVRWQYRIHEQILPALRKQGVRVCWSDVVVHHVGYQDPALRRRKLGRDIRLLELEDREHPDDPFTLFNLGSVYQELGKQKEALEYLRRSLNRSQPGDSIVRKLYALIAQCHRLLGQHAEARAACAEGREFYPDDAELLFQEALARREQEDRAGAEACLLRLIHGTEDAHFASVDTGLRGHKARHNLAVQYQDEGRLAEAEAQWQATVQQEPTFAPAWLGLAELYVAQGRWTELAQVVERLAQDAEAVMEAEVLRARGALARRDYATARQLLEAGCARFPNALWPQRILSHTLLQEGTDRAGAAQALQAILALAPGDVEARNNLSVLLLQCQAAGSPLDVTPIRTSLYEAVCRVPSDIHEHCPTLHALARDSRHVTELGTRTGNSTIALLHAQPDRLVCYDRLDFPHLNLLRLLAGRTEFVCHRADVREVEIEETDLLFIDTLHTYNQLRHELHLHARKARRYIVLHDTTTFAERGEIDGQGGLWPAVEEFLALGTFRLQQRYENNNGLTILEAVSR